MTTTTTDNRVADWYPVTGLRAGDELVTAGRGATRRTATVTRVWQEGTRWYVAVASGDSDCLLYPKGRSASAHVLRVRPSE